MNRKKLIRIVSTGIILLLVVSMLASLILPILT